MEPEKKITTFPEFVGLFLDNLLTGTDEEIEIVEGTNEADEETPEKDDE